MTTYSKYTPDFKCELDGNGKGVVNANVGLLTYDEVVYAGGYLNEMNNNYYLNNSDFPSWTMSPTGFAPGNSNSYVWAVGYSAFISVATVDNSVPLRAVLNLTADTLATGSGTSSDPFVIEPII